MMRRRHRGKRSTVPGSAPVCGGLRAADVQRRMWMANTRTLTALTGNMGPNFSAYARRYRRAVATAEAYCPRARMLEAARRSEVVFVGDYHPLAAARRHAVTLLRELLHYGPVDVGLEYFRVADQAALDAYGRNELDLDGLAVATAHAEQELPGQASWASYLPLLRLARIRGVKLWGLDSKARGPRALQTRDARAAAVLARALAARPARRLLVLAGQMHVVPGHLPRALRQAREPAALRYTVVYQNCERLWFAWGRGAGGRPPAVLRLRHNAYALMHTSPVACQLTYLAQLTQLGHDEAPQRPKEAFVAAVRRLAKIFAMPVPKALAQVRVRMLGELGELGAHLAVVPAAGQAHLRRQLMAGHSAVVPGANAVFLASCAAGTLGEEAGHYLRLCRPRGRPPRQEEGQVETFYRHALEEALGYLAARVCRAPKRAPSHRLLRQLALRGPRAQQSIARATLAQLDLQAGKPPAQALTELFLADAEALDAVAHLTGYFLGEQLFMALQRRKVSKAQLGRLFARPTPKRGAAFAAYLAVLAWLRPHRQG